MRTLAPPVAAVLLALVLVAPAQAEKWLYFPLKGGALAFDKDSLKTDVTTGSVAANTVVYYEKARPVGAESYRFQAERLEFECRGTKHRWSQSAVLDTEGRVVLAREDGDWTELANNDASTVAFKRMLCAGEVPPGGKEAADMDALMSAVRGPSLAAFAYSSPRSAAPAGAVTAPSASAAPPVSKAAAPAAPLPPAPKVEPAAPKLVTAPTPAPAAEPKSTPASTERYDQAPRCVTFKQQSDLRWTAVNDCNYPVTFGWCVTGGRNAAYECQAPTFLRGGGAVQPKTQAAVSYPGGVGRAQIFACRAPGAPRVRQVDGRFEYDCPG